MQTLHKPLDNLPGKLSQEICFPLQKEAHKYGDKDDCAKLTWSLFQNVWYVPEKNSGRRVNWIKKSKKKKLLFTSNASLRAHYRQNIEFKSKVCLRNNGVCLNLFFSTWSSGVQIKPHRTHNPSIISKKFTKLWTFHRIEKGCDPGKCGSGG